MSISGSGRPIPRHPKEPLTYRPAPGVTGNAHLVYDRGTPRGLLRSPATAAGLPRWAPGGSLARRSYRTGHQDFAAQGTGVEAMAGTAFPIQPIARKKRPSGKGNDPGDWGLEQRSGL